MSHVDTLNPASSSVPGRRRELQPFSFNYFSLFLLFSSKVTLLRCRQRYLQVWSVVAWLTIHCECYWYTSKSSEWRYYRNTKTQRGDRGPLIVLVSQKHTMVSWWRDFVQTYPWDLPLSCSKRHRTTSLNDFFSSFSLCFLIYLLLLPE